MVYRFFILILICVSVTSPARAEILETISDDVVGETTYYNVQRKDTLYKVARQFDVGIVELLSANPGVDIWVPKVGTNLAIPAQHVLPAAERRGIIINLSEMRLFYFPNPYTVLTFPIGIGMDGWETVTGDTVIIKKREHPSWIPPDSIREEDPTLPDVIPPGPNNPLGDYALNLGFEGYRIHGTNRPDGIGRRSSHGCIRLYPEDIAALFSTVDVGTSVQIIDTPYKLGWQENTLFLEVTPDQQQSDAIMRREPLKITEIPQIYGDIQTKAGTSDIDWRAVHEAVMWRSGIPIAIAKKESR